MCFPIGQFGSVHVAKEPRQNKLTEFGLESNQLLMHDRVMQDATIIEAIEGKYIELLDDLERARAPVVGLRSKRGALGPLAESRPSRWPRACRNRTIRNGTEGA